MTHDSSATEAERRDLSLETDESVIKCPDCGSEAYYRYGRTMNGKQRARCLMCGRQFIIGSGRQRVKNRPDCPRCGKMMHLYKKEQNSLRFRCSGYPTCKTYAKIDLE
jgi:transposase-like protein